MHFNLGYFHSDAEYLAVLRGAVEEGHHVSPNTTTLAAQYGFINSLRYAHGHGAPWHAFTTAIAAQYGQLECLRYAHEHGCEWHPTTTVTAVAYGHFECLRYAHEHGCPWDMYSTIIAAENGRLDLLRYVHENGCPWLSDVATAAAEYENWDCLRYAVTHGCGVPDAARRNVVRKVWLPMWREHVKTRGVAFYWMGEACKSSCADGADGRKRDHAAFEADFATLS